MQTICYSKSVLVKTTSLCLLCLLISFPAQADVFRDLYYGINGTLSDMRTYLDISEEEASDEELKFMLRFDNYSAYRPGLKAVLSQIKFGQGVDIYIAGSAGCSPPSEEESFTDFLSEPASQAILAGLQTTLSIWSGGEILHFWMIYSTVSDLLSLHSATGTYAQLADAITCFNKRHLMYEFIAMRKQGHSLGVAWDEITNTYGDIVDAILAITEVEPPTRDKGT